MIEDLVRLGPNLLEQVKQRGKLIGQREKLQQRRRILLELYGVIPVLVDEVEADIKETDAQISMLLTHDS